MAAGSTPPGLPKTMTRPDAVTNTYLYDVFGRLLDVWGADIWAPLVRYTYFDSTAPLRIETRQYEVGGCSTCTQALVTQEFFDGLGRSIQTRAEISEGSSQSVVNTVYDALGRTVTTYVPTSESWTTSFSRPAGWDTRPKTSTSYDALSRVTAITAPDTTTYHYYALDNDSNASLMGYTNTSLWVHSSKDANNRARHEIMDAQGRVIKVREFKGTCYPTSCPGGTGDPNRYLVTGETVYDYTTLDQLWRVTDAAGIPTTINYNSLGQKSDMTDPDMGKWVYEYTPGTGTLWKQTDARGCLTTMTYDDLDRLTGKTFSGPGACATTPAMTYSYGTSGTGKGHRTSMTDGSGSTTWTYDARGRLSSESKIISGVGGGTFLTQWDYDLMDRPKWVKYPGGSVGQTGGQLD